MLVPWLPHSGWGVQLSYDCPPHPGCPQSQGCDVAILCCSHWELQKRLSVRLSQVHGGCVHFIAVSFAVVPALVQAETAFAGALTRINVEDLADCAEGLEETAGAA